MKKRILFLTGYYNNRGGVISMLTLIRELKTRGYEVELIIGKHGSAEEVEHDFGINSKYMRSFSWVISLEKKERLFERLKNVLKRVYNSFSEARLYQRIKNFQPDVVVMNSSNQYVGIRSCNRLGIPVIMYFREFMTLDHNSCYWSEKMAKRYFAKLNGGIAISESIREYFLQYVNEICVIYNGIDIEKYRGKARKKTNKGFIISCVGALNDGKNQMLAIKAARILFERRIMNFHLYFYGDGDEEYIKRLKEFVLLNGLEKQVSFEGAVSDLKEKYAEAHINLICSRYEAFGRVILEGMINHCLSVAADSGGAKEIVNNNENGLLFKSDDELALSDVLVYAINHYKELQNLVEQGFQDVGKKYSLCVSTNQVEDYVNEVCSKRR